MQLEPVQKCSHYVYQWTVYLSMTSTLGQPAQHETKQNARMLLTVWTRISCVFSHNSNSALVFSKHVPQGHTKLPPSKSFPRKVLLLSNHYSQGLTGAWKWKFNPADLTTGPSLTGRPGDLFDRMVGKPVCVCVCGTQVALVMVGCCMLLPLSKAHIASRMKLCGSLLMWPLRAPLLAIAVALISIGLTWNESANETNYISNH